MLDRLERETPRERTRANALANCPAAQWDKMSRRDGTTLHMLRVVLPGISRHGPLLPPPFLYRDRRGTTPAGRQAS